MRVSCFLLEPTKALKLLEPNELAYAVFGAGVVRT